MGFRRSASSIAFGLAFCAPAVAAAQDPISSVSGYVTLSSGYWKHGLVQAKDPTLQLGIDYQHHTGFFAYARAMNVDYPPDYRWRTRDVEASAYVGYHDRHEVWSWTVSLGRYFYPDTGAVYDYDELSASVGYRDRVFYTASYSAEYYGVLRSALSQDVSVLFPLRGDIEVGGSIGRFDLEGGPDITHWNFGVSKLFASLAVDLRYYDGDYERDSYLGYADGDHYVVSLSYALRGKRFRPKR